ncbi:MAG: HAMP domain-containing sensor histidine kinase [Parvibaculum sp.]|nr:HAMP domain-containing sensor histidine kinase [Parvibaculum sp.]
MNGDPNGSLDFTRRFVRSLAHDANNLTGAILVLSELLLMADAERPGRVTDLARKIHKACWQLQIRINQPVALDYLAWAGRGRIEAARLQEVAQDLLSTLMPKKVSARIETSAGDLTVAGTELLLAIVMFNLLRNAATAIGDADGEVVLHLTAHDDESAYDGELLLQRGAFEPGQRYLRLSVEDSGAGFAAETVALSFLPFHTSDKTGRRLGLGLYFVDTLVDGLRGVLTVRRGARTGVDVFLPLAGLREKGDVAPDGDAVPALRHIALVTTDSAWAERFVALATPMGAQIAVFGDPSRVALADGEESRYSALVMTGAQSLSSALIEQAQQMRLPCLAIAPIDAPEVAERIGDLRPVNLLSPSEGSAAEALHRLLAHGAMQ